MDHIFTVQQTSPYESLSRYYSTFEKALEALKKLSSAARNREDVSKHFESFDNPAAYFQYNCGDEYFVVEIRKHAVDWGCT